MIELKNRLPASLCDMDESYKDDIIRYDATLATGTPGLMLAGLPCEKLVRSQYKEKYQEHSDGLTSRCVHTTRATRAANISRVSISRACVRSPIAILLLCSS